MKNRLFFLKVGGFIFLSAIGLFFAAVSMTSAESLTPLKKEVSCDNDCLEQKALLGDGKIAYEIGNSYMYKDRAKMKYWYRISAENGNIDGQHNYAHFLAIDSKNSEDCYRAIFWFSMAAKKGDKVSQEYRKKIMNLMGVKNSYKDGCSIEYQSQL